jgi:hypothetical protein
VIYRVHTGNPVAVFVAQRFPSETRMWCMFQSAPITDVQKFVQIASSIALTVFGLGQAVPIAIKA